MTATAVETAAVDQLPLAPTASESAAILNVIERMAVNPDIDPDRIERFIALKERIDANAAKKAFDAAVAIAKATIPAAEKNRTGHNSKRYADFYAYAKVVDPVLSELGLSYRFRPEQTDCITVTCVLSHKDGHSEQSTLSGPADTSGSKNAIQAIGSTLTYLQRYTLIAALGLAAAEDDDGAAAGAGASVSDDQRDELLALIEETGADLPRFCRHYNVGAVQDLPATKFASAKALLETKRRAAQ